MAGTAVTCHAFARAGLLGNPSDGYFGRTLSMVLRDFRATVTLEESTDLRIEPGPDDDVFPSLGALIESVRRQGYYGGARLVKAAIKTFAEHCLRADVSLPSRNFTACYASSIPRQVGLAGSSAIVTATLRALMQWFAIDIPKEQQANLILSAETEELGITAGLQDRVVQVYGGLVYMDFAKDVMERRGWGTYEQLDPNVLPRLYVAYQTQPAKVSGRVLQDVMVRWENGDALVLETLDRIAGFATSGKAALLEGRHDLFAALMNENFNLRRRIMHIDERDLTMVELARDLGASAKLTGSGGAIIGMFRDNRTYQALARQLATQGARVIEAKTA